VFNYFLISIVIAPILLGVAAGRAHAGGRGRSVLLAGWLAYALLWFGALYYLRHRWA
jgi:hypothetical protein